MVFTLFSLPAFADTTQVINNADAKNALVTQYEKNFKNYSTNELKLHRDTVDSTLAKLVTTKWRIMAYIG